MAQAHTGPYPPGEAEGGRALSPWQRLARGILRPALDRLQGGALLIDEGHGATLHGDPAGALQARAVVHDPRAWTAGVLGGEVGLGDAYLRGWWSSPDPVAVVRLAVRNMAAFDHDGPLSWALRALNRVRHLGRANHLEGSRRNIAHHYDLGNDFYRLFLDDTLAYSCAVWERPDQTLAEAQRAKFDLIARKLDLGPSDHLLEIGTGWGGFAVHAAERYGCEVTTTTLSARQHDFVAHLLRERGLEGRVHLLLRDYRELTGSFDKAVSIEMFEAVGHRFYDAYFCAVDRLLKPGGLFLLQTITMNEQHFPDYLRGSDWIQRRIFPGAELASVALALRSVARRTSLQLHHVEDLGLHYARTLAAWRQRFHARIEGVRALGFDGDFLRMWDWYLAYCEGAFQERHIGDAQLLLGKAGGAYALPNEPWGRP